MMAQTVKYIQQKYSTFVGFDLTLNQHCFEHCDTIMINSYQTFFSSTRFPKILNFFGENRSGP